MKKEEKERYKKKLLTRKNEIINKLNEVYTESKEVEPDFAQDVGDKAETSYTKEFLLSLSDSERKQLLMIDEALKRIEACEYGTCQMCHKPISKKRLNAIPWAIYCIQCQEKAESESS
ncbi:MAG: TraR/DksA family transcriptional regulator [Candidatus Aminicenantales bacterium]